MLLASKDGREGSVQVSQDASLRVTVLAPGERREAAVKQGRHAWVHVARGAALVDGAPLAEGDAAAVSGPARLELQGREDAEVLLFDLA